MITAWLVGSSVGLFVMAFVSEDTFLMTGAIYVLLLAILRRLFEGK